MTSMMYDQKSQASPTPTAVAVINQLKRFHDYSKLSDQCSIFPAVRDLVMNLTFSWCLTTGFALEIPTSLRSASSLQLDVPRTHRRTVGDRAFAAAGPTLWNSLPLDVTDRASLTSFCRKLKTILSSVSFPGLHFSFSSLRGFYFGHFKISYAWMYVRMYSSKWRQCSAVADMAT